MPINYSFGLPLKNQYTDYLTLEGFLNGHEAELVKKLWNPNQVEPAAVLGASGQAERHDIRSSNLVFISPDNDNKWLFDRLAQAAVENNNYYYHFDVLGFHEELQLASYDQSHHFDWHMDLGPGPTSTRKLSLSIQLSDPATYEGGDLQFMINNQIHTAPRTMGTLIVFPSYLMHRVTPIQSGNRMSVVGWVTGPPYR